MTNETLFLIGRIALTLVTAVSVYFNYRVVKHFRKDADYAATKFFIDERMPDVFKVIVLSAILYSIPALIVPLLALLKLFTQSEPIASYSPVTFLQLAASVFLYAVSAYFHFHVARTTEKPGTTEASD